MNTVKRALLIGIDKYDNFETLKGCANDVNVIAPLISKHSDGSLNFDCRALVTRQTRVKRRQILEAIEQLFAPGADVALFYFAGHGFEMKNDVGLVSSDGDALEPGIPTSLLLGKVQQSQIREVILILDCCYSGGGGGHAMLGPDMSLLRRGVAVLTGSRADQNANEQNGRGEFTTHLCAALEGGAADVLGNVTLAGIYSYLTKYFDAWSPQHPTFKANLEDSRTLRRTAPQIPLATLRGIPTVFRTPAYEIALDPQYERYSSDPHPAKVAVFDVLAQLNRGGLIELVGADYLYDAAMKSKKCRLSPLGRHIWNLVDKRLM
jgi:hypothetical protein